MALLALNELFVHVCEQEAVPDEWRQGIIIPLHTGPSVATTEELHCSRQQGTCLHISY